MSTDLVLYLLKAESIDTIINFAAQVRLPILSVSATCSYFYQQTHVDNSFGNSFSFTQNNVYGTHNLLESARLYGSIKRFIHVSTDEVYGEASHGTGEASGEHATLEPTNPYSATKAAAEMLVKVRIIIAVGRSPIPVLTLYHFDQAYYTSYQLPCIITRGNNVYGPHQYPEKLIPKFILLASKGAMLPIHGTGASLRSFLYVSLFTHRCRQHLTRYVLFSPRYVTDVADAFDVIVHKGVIGETYNIGTNEERSVLQVADDICSQFNLDPRSKVEYVQNRLFNDRRYVC